MRQRIQRKPIASSKGILKNYKEYDIALMELLEHRLQLKSMHIGEELPKQFSIKIIDTNHQLDQIWND